MAASPRNSNNVKSITSPEAATIDEAMAWINQMAEKGVYPSSTARFRISAIRNLCSILTPDEPQSAQWALAHLDEIGKRWATKKNAKPETASVYVSRAQGGFEDFLAYLEDPLKNKPRRRDGVRVRNEDSKEKIKTPPPADAAPADASPSTRHTATWRTFPLGDSRQAIEYRLPDTGITMRDAFKFAIHLATMATDFDLADAVMSKVFALAKFGDQGK